MVEQGESSGLDLRRRCTAYDAQATPRPHDPIYRDADVCVDDSPTLPADIALDVTPTPTSLFLRPNLPATPLAIPPYTRRTALSDVLLLRPSLDCLSEKKRGKMPLRQVHESFRGLGLDGLKDPRQAPVVEQVQTTGESGCCSE